MRVLQRKKHMKEVRNLFRTAVRAVQAPQLLRRFDWKERLNQPFDGYGRVVVLGFGKASMAMGGVLEQQLQDGTVEGLLVVPEGYMETLPDHIDGPQQLDVLEAGHPLPNEGSQRAAERLLELADSSTEDDLVIVLISGGGTALTFAPVDGVSMDEAQDAFTALMEAGADIQAMNAVRKHLSRVGGGQLARAAAPAEVLALAVSDVPGDALDVIASGPTVPDPTTFDEALGVLDRNEITEAVPPSVRSHLEEGAAGNRGETPKAGDDLFRTVHTELIGANRTALEAAAHEASGHGWSVQVRSDVTGEAREVGRQLVQDALAAEADRPFCLVTGGETTVTVRGEGTGGRNQEMALAAALELDAQNIPDDTAVIFLSAGTDGIDGPTDAAGAFSTAETVRRARRNGLDAQSYLDNNNSYHFFEQAGGLLRTGPTHTNVMDVQIVLAR